MDDRIELLIDGAIARLTIRRGDKLNALDAAMVDAIVPLCRQVERSAARVVILTGEGSKAFSAGGDIAAWGQSSAEDFGRHWVRDGHTAFDALARLTVPVIAVLNGHALGGGFELASCADLRIAERHVKLSMPETGIGIIPGWSGSQRAVQRFGAQVIRRMALFGEVFTAGEGLALGLVDHLAETGAGMAMAELVAARVMARGGRATELAKMLINAAEGEEGPRVLEALAGSVAAGSGDLQEGLRAFAEKRKPDFGR